MASPKVWQPLFLKTKKILINTMQKGWQIESVAIQIQICFILFKYLSAFQYLIITALFHYNFNKDAED